MVVALFTTMVFIQLSFEGGLTRFGGIWRDLRAALHSTDWANARLYQTGAPADMMASFTHNSQPIPPCNIRKCSKTRLMSQPNRSRPNPAPAGRTCSEALGNPKASILIYLQFQHFPVVPFRTVHLEVARGRRCPGIRKVGGLHLEHGG